MEPSMFYYIYKITNKINNKIYIGMHKTNNLDDDYFGSGLNLNRAIKKYGKANFTKEILEFFDNEQDMFSKEKQLVNSNFVNSPTTYNLVEGGNGSFSYINSLPNQGHAPGQNAFAARVAGLKHSERMKTDATYRDNWRAKVSKSLKQSWNSRKNNERTSNNKIWITNFSLNKTTMIDLVNYPFYQEQGWIIGRKLKFNSNRGSYKKRN